MCQTCKRFKKFVRQNIPASFSHVLDVIYDLSTKHGMNWFIPLAGTLMYMFFTESTLVPILCALLFYAWWTILRDANVGEKKKSRLILPLLGMAIFLCWGCPIIQNKIDPPELVAHSPQNRSDAKHIIVRVENIGKSDLPKDKTIIRLGLLSLADVKPNWVEPNRLSQIQKNRQVAFRFPRPDSLPNYSVVLVQNKRLKGAYLLEPFYLFRNRDGDFVWGSYYENIGLVDDNDAQAMDKILKGLETCLDSHKFDGNYSQCL